MEMVKSASAVQCVTSKIKKNTQEMVNVCAWLGLKISDNEGEKLEKKEVIERS